MKKSMFRKKFIAVGVAFATVLTQACAVTSVVAADNAEIEDGCVATVEFGKNVNAKNCTVFNGDSNNPLVAFEQGKEVWKLDPTNGTSNRYIYVDIDDDVLYNKTDGTTLEVEVEYFDAENTSLALEYPKFEWENLSTKKPAYSAQANVTNATELEILDFEGTNTWKTYTWTLSRAWLNNSMNGADFRVGVYSPTMYYSKNPVAISSIKVRDTKAKDCIDIKVDSENIGHMFYTGDKMKFDVEFDNSTTHFDSIERGDFKAEITYTITDSKNNVCGKVVHNADIKASQIYKDTVEFTPDKYDVYIFKAEIKSEDGKICSSIKRESSYVRSSKGAFVNERAGISIPTNVNNFYGADKDWVDKYAKMIKYAGYNYVRINTSLGQTAMSSYEHITPNEIANHATFGDVFKGFKDNGLKIMMYTTMFENSNPLGQMNWLEKEGQTIPYTDEGRKRFSNIEEAILNEHLGSIDVWEIGNEPNLDKVRTSDDKHAAEMAEMDKYDFPRLKALFPNVKIGTSQLSGFSDNNPWFKNYFEAGGNVGQDFISFHPYTANGDPITVNPMARSNPIYGEKSAMDLIDYCEEYGYDGEIWATEYGKSEGWYMCPQDEEYQSMWNVSNYINMTEGNYIDKLILFRLDEAYNGARNNIEYTYGIIRTLKNTEVNRGAAKPAYVSQANLNYMMHDAVWVDKFKINNNTEGHRYKKTDTNEDMFVMHSNKKVDIASVDLGTNKVTLTDIYGNETELTSESGVYTFNVTEAAFYCTGNFTKFEIVDSSDVYPMETEISVIYDGTAEVTFVNKTNESLDVSFEINGLSGTTIDEGQKVAPGVSAVKINCSPYANEAIEKIGIKLSGKDGVKYHGVVALNYSMSIQLKTELKNINGEWTIPVTVSNSSDTKTINGTVKLMYPYDMAEQMQGVKVTSMPNSSEVYELALPDDISLGESITATIAFERDDGTIEAYNTERLDFVYVPKASGVVIDGNLAEWDSGWMYLNRVDQFEQVLGYGNDFRGTTDLWAKVALKWDDEYLYFGAEVHDDVYYATGVSAELMWQLDDFQIAFLYDPEGKIKSNSQFEEISFANLDGTPTVYRNKTVQSGLEDSSKVPGYELAIVEKNGTMYYEARFPWSSILKEGTKAPYAGSELKFGMLLNENDGMGRKGFYKLGDGIANTKDSSKFLTMYLSE